MRPYIDCHNHIGRTINRVPPVGQNTAMCLARFAETNIYSAISMPTAVGSPITRGVEDIRDQNEVIARACKDFPDQFPIGLALIEPRFGKRGFEETDKAISELGLAGIVGCGASACQGRFNPICGSSSHQTGTMQFAPLGRINGGNCPDVP